jgi:hypothetical protein
MGQHLTVVLPSGVEGRITGYGVSPRGATYCPQLERDLGELRAIRLEFEDAVIRWGLEMRRMLGLPGLRYRAYGR